MKDLIAYALSVLLAGVIAAAFTALYYVAMWAIGILP